MSREERRNYQRMMRDQERGPSLPPAAKARAERNAVRRAARRGGDAPRTHGFGLRFWLVSILVAVAVGYVAFSIQWPNMPFAAYVGGIVGAITLVVLVAVRVAQRSAAGR